MPSLVASTYDFRIFKQLVLSCLSRCFHCFEIFFRVCVFIKHRQIFVFVNHWEHDSCFQCLMHEAGSCSRRNKRGLRLRCFRCLRVFREALKSLQNILHARHSSTKVITQKKEQSSNQIENSTHYWRAPSPPLSAQALVIA